MTKNPADRSRDELIAVVTGLLRILYGDVQEDGSWRYSVDKPWSGADVCESLASLLDRFGLVPGLGDDGKVIPPGRMKEDAEDSADAPTASLRYDLTIDGPALRAQRKRLVELADALDRGQPAQLAPSDKELLDGLVNLTDEIADQAADRYGIDCLLSAAGS